MKLRRPSNEMSEISGVIGPAPRPRGGRLRLAAGCALALLAFPLGAGHCPRCPDIGPVIEKDLELGLVEQPGETRRTYRIRTDENVRSFALANKPHGTIESVSACNGPELQTRRNRLWLEVDPRQCYEIELTTRAPERRFGVYIRTRTDIGREVDGGTPQGIHGSLCPESRAFSPWTVDVPG